LERPRGRPRNLRQWFLDSHGRDAWGPPRRSRGHRGEKIHLRMAPAPCRPVWNRFLFEMLRAPAHTRKTAQKGVVLAGGCSCNGRCQRENFWIKRRSKQIFRADPPQERAGLAVGAAYFLHSPGVLAAAFAFVMQDLTGPRAKILRPEPVRAGQRVLPPFARWKAMEISSLPEEAGAKEGRG